VVCVRSDSATIKYLRLSLKTLLHQIFPQLIPMLTSCRCWFFSLLNVLLDLLLHLDAYCRPWSPITCILTSNSSQLLISKLGLQTVFSRDEAFTAEWHNDYWGRGFRSRSRHGYFPRSSVICVLLLHTLESEEHVSACFQESSHRRKEEKEKWKVITFLLCILKVPGLYLGSEAGCFDRLFPWSS
jgi:hypothetical protein